MCYIERIFLFRFVLMLSNSFAWRKISLGQAERLRKEGNKKFQDYGKGNRREYQKTT